MQINVQFYRKEAPYIFSGESDTSHVILSAITQESPKNHPRITQESPKFVKGRFRWNFGAHLSRLQGRQGRIAGDIRGTKVGTGKR